MDWDDQKSGNLEEILKLRLFSASLISFTSNCTELPSWNINQTPKNK